MVTWLPKAAGRQLGNPRSHPAVWWVPLRELRRQIRSTDIDVRWKSSKSKRSRSCFGRTLNQNDDHGLGREKCSRASTIPIRTMTLKTKPTTKENPAAYFSDRSLRSKTPGGLSLCTSETVPFGKGNARRQSCFYLIRFSA